MTRQSPLRYLFDDLTVEQVAPWRRLIIGLVLLSSLLLFGVAGYMIIEGWSFFDALFMTVTTVTTVGYREVHPLDTGGRIFTIFVIFFGVGVAFYILTTVVQSAVEGEFAQALGVRRMQQKIEALRDHYILCGFGRVGEEIAREYRERDVPFVIIENNPEAVARATAGLPAHRRRCDPGRHAGARGHPACARVAGGVRLRRREHVHHADREGAPAGHGCHRSSRPAGRRMALSALQPLTVDFFDILASGRQGEQLLAELVVSEDSDLAGHSVHDVLHLARATSLLAIQHPDGELVVGPPDTHVINLGDRLILLSNEPDIEALGRNVAGA